MDMTNAEGSVIDSLNKRYFYKLSSNIVAFVLSLINASIVPRGLGPGLYGNFSFLTNFFTTITGFLDMGTSFYFYNELSKRPKDFSLAAFYRYFMLVVALIVVGFVVFAHLTSIRIYLWPDQKPFYIYLAAGWAILTWITNLFNKMTDAYGLTVPAEKARIFQKFVGIIVLIFLYISSQLSLRNYFYYQYFILFFIGAMFIGIMESKGYSISKGWKLSLPRIKNYSNGFYHFSHPLFVTSVVGLLVGILDRWLLQVFGGSVQQGFFGFSYQIGTLCFLVVGAMSPLLMREFSIGFGNKDLKQVASLFRKYIPLMYSVTAFLSCFIAIQADKVIYIIAGDKYSQAVIPVTIMAFVPIHQTYGQLTGAVLLSAGKTRLHRNINVIFMLIGLPVTYFLIAPKQLGGINAGATGLAIKTVLSQLILVNICLFFSAKLVKLNFWRYLGHQICSVGCLLLIAIFVIFGIGRFLDSGISIIFKFFISGILYTLITIIIVYWFPILFGIKKEDILLIVKLIISKLKHIFS